MNGYMAVQEVAQSGVLLKAGSDRYRSWSKELLALHA